MNCVLFLIVFLCKIFRSLANASVIVCHCFFTYKRTCLNSLFTYKQQTYLKMYVCKAYMSSHLLFTVNKRKWYTAFFVNNNTHTTAHPQAYLHICTDCVCPSKKKLFLFLKIHTRSQQQLCFCMIKIMYSSFCVPNYAKQFFSKKLKKNVKLVFVKCKKQGLKQ